MIMNFSPFEFDMLFVSRLCVTLIDGRKSQFNLNFQQNFSKLEKAHYNEMFCRTR